MSSRIHLVHGKPEALKQAPLRESVGSHQRRLAVANAPPFRHSDVRSCDEDGHRTRHEDDSV